MYLFMVDWGCCLISRERLPCRAEKLNAFLAHVERLGARRPSAHNERMSVQALFPTLLYNAPLLRTGGSRFNRELLKEFSA
jgi:hypothetical protein